MSLAPSAFCFPLPSSLLRLLLLRPTFLRTTPGPGLTAGQAAGTGVGQTRMADAGASYAGPTDRGRWQSRGTPPGRPMSWVLRPCSTGENMLYMIIL